MVPVSFNGPHQDVTTATATNPPSLLFLLHKNRYNSGAVSPAPTRETLLLVDDDKIILDLLCRTFKPSYDVHAAASGEEALRILREKLIDLLITDQKMPVMTGLDLIA